MVYENEADGTALTETEAALVKAATAGEHADLKRRPIRASVLRDLLLEARPGWVLPPVGLRLSKAIVQGCLDLEGAVLTKPFLIWHSRFEGGGDKGALVLREARLRRLGIHSCTVEGNIVADRAELDNGLFLGGGTFKGLLQLRGASIGGALSLDGSELGDGTTALQAAGLRVEGPLIIRRARISGGIAVSRAHLEAGIYGEAIRIVAPGRAIEAESARIGGDVLLTDSRIEGSVGLVNVRLQGRFAGERMEVTGGPVAIDARGLEASHGVVLDGARLRGSLLLDGAKIGNMFNAEGVEIDGGETAIGADVVQIGGNCALPRAKLIGQVSLPGASIEGQLRLTEARLFGTDIALRADGARIRGGCFMSRAKVHGLVRFPAADIGNQLRLRGASIKVEAGAALLGSGATFRRDIELTDGCQLTGAVVLDQAHVLGALDLTGSRISSAAITRGSLPVPPAWSNAVAFADETAISLVDSVVNRLVMPASRDDRPRGVVDLSRARAGSFEDYAEAWPPPVEARARAKDGRDIEHMRLDGFVYEHLTNPSGATVLAQGQSGSKASERVASRRVLWLKGQDERDVRGHFKPQAWVALADRLARQGYTDDARRIEIARRRRERRSDAATFGARWQSRLLDWLALYGHNPWRTVVWMAVVVIVFAGIWGGAARLCAEPGCFDESVLVVRNKDAYRDERFHQTYPAFHALAYSFDVFVPFVAFGYEDHWRPNLDYGPIAELPLPWPIATEAAAPSSTPNALGKGPTLSITIGGILYVLTIVEALLGLVLTSLMVTGFTGLLRDRSE